MTPVLVSRPQDETEVAFPVLAALGWQLRRRGWTATLNPCQACGAADGCVRVHGGTAALVVEVPHQCAQTPGEGFWRATRIKPLSRITWAGPSRLCARGELLDFVEDLLCCDIDELSGRYVRID